MAQIIPFERPAPKPQPPAPDPWAAWLALVAAQLELTASLLRQMAGGR